MSEKLLDIISKNYRVKTSSKEEANGKCENMSSEVEKVTRFTSEGNLSSVTLVMQNIKNIIDVVMSDKNILFTVNGHDESLKIPSITYDVVSRELSSKTPLSSIKTNSIKEFVNNKPTGDNFEIYTTIFDCIVEFNIYGKNKTNSVEIQEEFEEMLELYKGYLKKQGLSNMYFVKEVSCTETLKNKSYHGVTLVYFLEIQKIKSIRTSSLNNVGVTIEERLKKDNQDILKAINVLDELSRNNKII